MLGRPNFRSMQRKPRGVRGWFGGAIRDSLESVVVLDEPSVAGEAARHAEVLADVDDVALDAAEPLDNAVELLVGRRRGAGSTICGVDGFVRANMASPKNSE